jgi:hypothetical protein
MGEDMDQGPLALASLDTLMQGLKDGEESAIAECRRILHDLADESSPSQLWALLIPVRILLERETNVNKE